MKNNSNEKISFGIKDDGNGFPVRLYIDDNDISYAEQSPLHRHRELELLVVYSGAIRLYTSSEIVELSRGQGILINSGVMHRIVRTSTDTLCPYIMFSDEIIASGGTDISLKYVKPFIANSDHQYVLLDTAVLWQRRILGLSGEIFSLLYKYAGAAAHNPTGLTELGEEESPCFELDVKRRICEIWSLMYSNLGSESRDSVLGNEYIVRKRTQLMVEYIRENYRTQISLAEIAASANISKSEASRCFQSCLHTSPVSYLLRYRVEMAAHMLQNTAMTIEAISFECGFGSASYFCKMFQRYAGITPGAFRKGNTSRPT